jgi:hypothetical protein
MPGRFAKASAEAGSIRAKHRYRTSAEHIFHAAGPDLVAGLTAITQPPDDFSLFGFTVHHRTKAVNGK